MKPFAYYKIKAKKILGKRVFKSAAVALFSLLLTAFVNLYITRLFPDNFVNSLIISIAVSILVVYPFTMGINVFLMNMVRGKEAKAGDVFDGYKYFFKLIPYMIIAMIISYGSSYIIEILLKLGSKEDIFIKLISYVVMAIPVIAEVALSFTMYILYDEKISGIKAMIKSIKLTWGSIVYLILLILSFILWVIPAVFTLGTIFLYLVPYMNITMIMVYDDLKNKNNNVGNNKEKESEL